MLNHLNCFSGSQGDTICDFVWSDCFFPGKPTVPFFLYITLNHPKSATCPFNIGHQRPEPNSLFFACNPATKNWTAWWTNHLWIDPQSNISNTSKAAKDTTIVKTSLKQHSQCLEWFLFEVSTCFFLVNYPLKWLPWSTKYLSTNRLRTAKMSTARTFSKSIILTLVHLLSGKET